jgi:Lar family restriction alleviation protein
VRGIETIVAEGMAINLKLEPGDLVLPCPFCGGKPELQNTHTAAYWLECECGAEVHGRAFGQSLSSVELTHRHHRNAKKSALAAWNRRTPS